MRNRPSKGLELRVARRVWRDYYRHSFARQHNADPSTDGLADQQPGAQDPGRRLGTGGTRAEMRRSQNSFYFAVWLLQGRDKRKGRGGGE